MQEKRPLHPKVISSKKVTSPVSRAVTTVRVISPVNRAVISPVSKAVTSLVTSNVKAAISPVINNVISSPRQPVSKIPMPRTTP